AAGDRSASTRPAGAARARRATPARGCGPRLHGCPADRDRGRATPPRGSARRARWQSDRTISCAQARQQLLEAQADVGVAGQVGLKLLDGLHLSGEPIGAERRRGEAAEPLAAEQALAQVDQPQLGQAPGRRSLASRGLLALRLGRGLLDLLLAGLLALDDHDLLLFVGLLGLLVGIRGR